MNIRKAIREDKNQLLYLVNKFDDYYIEGKIFPENFLPFVKYKDKNKLFQEVVDDWLHNPKYFIYVAEENGNLVGYICGTIQAKSQRVLNKEGFIEDWFVLDEYRHIGVGKQLYDILMKDFKNEQCNRLGLKAYAANKETIEMYRRMGFIDAELAMVKN